MNWEYDFIVFDIEKGPKIIQEVLNTHGAEGWELTTMITVGGGEHIVAWIVKRGIIEAPDPTKTKESKIAALWSSNEEESGGKKE